MESGDFSLELSQYLEQFPLPQNIEKSTFNINNISTEPNMCSNNSSCQERDAQACTEELFEACDYKLHPQPQYYHQQSQNQQQKIVAKNLQHLNLLQQETQNRKSQIPDNAAIASTSNSIKISNLLRQYDVSKQGSGTNFAVVQVPAPRSAETGLAQSQNTTQPSDNTFIQQKRTSIDVQTLLKNCPLFNQLREINTREGCTQHPDKLARYCFATAGSVNDRRFCSKCALEIAINNGFSQHQNEENEYKIQSLREFDALIAKEKSKLLDVHTQLSERQHELREHYLQEIKQMVYRFMLLDKVINDEKNQFLKMLNTSMQGTLGKIEEVANVLKSHENEMQRFQADIAGNLDNIVHEMERDSFDDILGAYRQRLAEFSEYQTRVSQDGLQVLRLRDSGNTAKSLGACADIIKRDVFSRIAAVEIEAQSLFINVQQHYSPPQKQSKQILTPHVLTGSNCFSQQKSCKQSLTAPDDYQKNQDYCSLTSQSQTLCTEESLLLQNVSQKYHQNRRSKNRRHSQSVQYSARQAGTSATPSGRVQRPTAGASSALENSSTAKITTAAHNNNNIFENQNIQFDFSENRQAPAPPSHSPPQPPAHPQTLAAQPSVLFTLHNLSNSSSHFNNSDAHSFNAKNKGNVSGSSMKLSSGNDSFVEWQEQQQQQQQPQQKQQQEGVVRKLVAKQQRQAKRSLQHGKTQVVKNDSIYTNVLKTIGANLYHGAVPVIDRKLQQSIAEVKTITSSVGNSLPHKKGTTNTQIDKQSNALTTFGNSLHFDSTDKENISQWANRSDLHSQQ